MKETIELTNDLIKSEAFQLWNDLNNLNSPSFTDDFKNQLILKYQGKDIDDTESIINAKIKKIPAKDRFKGIYK